MVVRLLLLSLNKRLDGVGHLVIDILTTQAPNEPYDAKCERRIRNQPDASIRTNAQKLRGEY